REICAWLTTTSCAAADAIPIPVDEMETEPIVASATAPASAAFNIPSLHNREISTLASGATRPSQVLNRTNTRPNEAIMWQRNRRLYCAPNDLNFYHNSNDLMNASDWCGDAVKLRR